MNIIRKIFFTNLFVVVLLVVTGCNVIPVVDKDDLVVQNTESILDAVGYRKNFGVGDDLVFMPSRGDVKVLVIPIQFPDDLFSQQEIDLINYSYFGDGSDYETFKTFHEKSSYGALHISGTVLEPVTVEHHYQYYDNGHYDGHNYSGVDQLLKEAIRHYTKYNPEIEIADYDDNEDGFIDSIQMIYSAPVDFSRSNDFWWGYAPRLRASNGFEWFTWDNYNINTVVFHGVDFFSAYGGNSFSAIHETGHLLGLPDYYDYNGHLEDGIRGGLGGADPMDLIVGDHNPFSKLLLGWIDPVVVTESSTITIGKYVLSGDAIIVTNSFHSIFDEYFIMDFLTHDHINTEAQIFTESGLIMYHVDAKLNEGYNRATISNLFENNNSTGPKKLIKLEEADGNDLINTTATLAEESDLLRVGQSYDLVLYNGDNLCKVTVDEMTDDTMTLTFKFY